MLRFRERARAMDTTRDNECGTTTTSTVTLLL